MPTESREQAAGPSMTARITREFLDCTLEAAAFTHEAHLRVGVWHVLRFPPSEALRRLRRAIRAFNVSKGGVNSDTEGYHETITSLYVQLIASVLATCDAAAPEDELAATVVEVLGDRDLPLEYYTRDTLFSVRARQEWVPPDLRALPTGAACHDQHPADRLHSD